MMKAERRSVANSICGHAVLRNTFRIKSSYIKSCDINGILIECVYVKI